MATKQVIIDGIGPVSIYKRKGNRTIRLSIRPDGEVRVSIPAWLPYAAGVKFATSRKDWIARNRQTAPMTLAHGHRVGKAHRLSLEPHATDKITTRLDGNEIRVLYPLTTDPGSKYVQAAAEKAAVRALKKEAESLLPQRLRDLATQTGFHYTSVHVKRLKSRWGSCSSHQEITLNIFLMQLPWHLIDYVLVHELVHTKVMQHGAPFWAEFEKHLPSAKARRREIHSHQPILMPFQA
jgi:predicted metal-dependent hydrolase